MRLVNADMAPLYLNEAACEQIKNMPAVDAVEVVRCKECKYGDWDNKDADAIVCIRTRDGYWRSGSDFCSYGERKEGAE